MTGAFLGGPNPALTTIFSTVAGLCPGADNTSNGNLFMKHSCRTTRETQETQPDPGCRNIRGCKGCLPF